MTGITDQTVVAADNGHMISPHSLFGAHPVTIDLPLEHLKACHRRIEERLEVLERAARHWEDRREEAQAAFRNAFEFLDSSGALHTADEEESLFPRLIPRLEPGERSYLAGLEHDHTEAHRLYIELRAGVGAGAAREAVQGLVERLTALYRRHIASEDEELQAYAARLTEAELAEIAGEMRRRRGTGGA